MTLFLVHRDQPRKPSERVLLEHQAIRSVVRTVLARTGEGHARMSEHQLLMPKHLDIMPVIKLAAGDFFDPERGHQAGESADQERVYERPPIILYGDPGYLRPESRDASVMEHFSRARVFMDRKTMGLKEAILELRPTVLVCLSDAPSFAEKAGDLRHEFQRIIAFSALMGDREEAEARRDSLQRFGPVTFADDRLNQAVEASTAELQAETEPIQPGLWARNKQRFEEDRDHRRSRELEPFVAFGLAIELALFADED